MQAVEVVGWPQGLGNSEISVEQAWAGASARAFHTKETARSVTRTKDVLGTVRSRGREKAKSAVYIQKFREGVFDSRYLEI